MEIELVDGGGTIFGHQPNPDGVGVAQRRGSCPRGLLHHGRQPLLQRPGMENKAGDRFGLQFHPEVNDSEFGKEMFENFCCRLPCSP